MKLELLKPTIITNQICGTYLKDILIPKYNLVIFDLNNTITDYYTSSILDDIKQLIRYLKVNNIKVYIASNTFNKSVIKKIANKLNVKYIYHSFKPLPFYINKIIKKESINNEKAIIIGDHLFTDILVANICNIDSILVEPINKKEKIHSKFVRKIENVIIRKHRL